MTDDMDVLDINGLLTSKVMDRKTIHQTGHWHRAVHLYLFNKNYDLLLQKRSKYTDHGQDLYSISVTGHVNAGESSHDAMDREIKEELGLDPALMKIRFLFSYKSFVDTIHYKDYQFNDVYVCYYEHQLENIPYDKHAITHLKWVSIEEFTALTQNPHSDVAQVYQREWPAVVRLLNLN